MTTISTPTELITAVPFLLNAQPSESLVVIALSEGAIELALQVELPAAFNVDNGADKFADNYESFVNPLRQAKVDELLLLAYLPPHFQSEIGDQIWEQIQGVCEEIAPVKDFLIIRAGRWRSFLCKDLTCCDLQGEPMPDITSSAIAAEHVFQGLPMPPLELDNPRRTTLPLLIADAQREYQRCAPERRSKRGVIALLRLISHFAIAKELHDERLIADALVALTDIQVRDFGIGSHGDENLQLHCELWSVLLERAPGGYQAPTATLLAVVRYEAGDAEGAKGALERALCDDPHYSLAHLLQKTFAAGWPPEAFTTMRHQLHPKLQAELLG